MTIGPFICRLMVMALGGMLASTTAQAQYEAYRVQIISAQGHTIGYNENTPLIGVELDVIIDNEVSGGTPLPAIPLDGQIDLQLVGGVTPPHVGGVVQPVSSACQDMGPWDPLFGKQYQCFIAFPLPMVDRQQSQLSITSELTFEFTHQGTTYAAIAGTSVMGTLDLAYDAAAIPLPIQPDPICTDEANPLMPVRQQGGSFIFMLASGEVCGQPFFIDPPIAVGYQYKVSGAQIVAITAPSAQTVADADGYNMVAYGKYWVMPRLQPGQRYQFPSPVSHILINDIDAALQLDPGDQQAFALGLELTTPTGLVTIEQTPQVVDTEPRVQIGSEVVVPVPGTLDGAIEVNPAGRPVIRPGQKPLGGAIRSATPKPKRPAAKQKPSRED